MKILVNMWLVGIFNIWGILVFSEYVAFLLTIKRIMINKLLSSYITIIKVTHREYTPSNKTEVLLKSMNMYMWGIGTVNPLFVRGSYTQIKIFKKMK